MIPWSKPLIPKASEIMVRKVLRSGFVNDGPLTEKLERELAAFLGVRYAVMVTNGTSALFLALKAVGVRLDDEVILPDLTFIATANAVTLCGAKPVFVDIDEKTLTIDPQKIEKAITPRTKAIILVHVSGRAAKMREILALAKKNRIFVVEDAAEALGSKYRGRYLGTLGSAGCFSFTANKLVTSGQGGAVATNSPKIAKAIRMLKDQGRPVRGTGGADRHFSVGFNFKFTDIQAAVLLPQLRQIRRRTLKMQRIYHWYRKELTPLPWIKLLPFQISKGEIPLWIDALVEKRTPFISYLKKHGIETRLFWYPIHQQKPYVVRKDTFPHSTKASKKALWLPSSLHLTRKDIVFICQKIKDYHA